MNKSDDTRSVIFQSVVIVDLNEDQRNLQSSKGCYAVFCSNQIQNAITELGIATIWFSQWRTGRLQIQRSNVRLYDTMNSYNKLKRWYVHHTSYRAFHNRNWNVLIIHIYLPRSETKRILVAINTTTHTATDYTRSAGT